MVKTRAVAAKPPPPKPNRITKSFVTDVPKDNRPLGTIMQEWSKREKLKTGVRWDAMADAEVKTITTVARANALGVPFAHATQVVAKVSQLVKQRSVRRIATYQNGKLLRTSGPIQRAPRPSSLQMLP